MRPRNVDRLFDHRRCLWREAIPIELSGIDELSSCNIGAVSESSADRPAQVVDEHVVIAHFPLGIEQDAVEHVDHGTNLDFEAGFLEHFPGEAGLERLAKLEAAAWKAPLPRQRFESPLHEDDLSILNDDRTHADNRLAGILPRRPGRVDGNHDFFLGLEAQGMQDAALAANQTVLDPELVIAGACQHVAALGILLAAAPLRVHRAGLDTRDHPHVALRRSRKRSRDLLPHGLPAASHDGPEIICRVVVIERSQTVEVAGVERLKPPADEIERVSRGPPRSPLAALNNRTMKAHTKYLTLNIPSKMAFRNITPEVDEAVRSSGVQEGLVLVNTMHITSSVFINDNERGLHHDFGRWLEQLAPFNPDPDHYHHNRTGEDNADAHLKRQIMGREVVVAITKGKLDFGPWEQIFYGEFDGNRNKRVLIKVIGE